jgi:hypothetical protein
VEDKSRVEWRKVQGSSAFNHCLHLTHRAVSPAVTSSLHTCCCLHPARSLNLKVIQYQLSSSLNNSSIDTEPKAFSSTPSFSENSIVSIHNPIEPTEQHRPTSHRTSHARVACITSKSNKLWSVSPSHEM